MPNYKKSRKHVVKTTLKPVQKQTGPDYVFTSESVSAGHPDKICDQISDMILDMYLEKDSEARVACETTVTNNRILIAGEINSTSLISKSEIKEAVYKKINQIGYHSKGWWPMYDNDFCSGGPSLWKRMTNRKIRVDVDLHQQSKEINRGVNEDKSIAKEQGAGDQGIMFGYACGSETTNYMPEAIYYSHRIMETINDVRLNKFPNLGPDAKCQLSVKYQNGLPVGVTSIVLSTQHVEDADPQNNPRIRDFITQTLPTGWVNNSTVWHINPSGSFITGGPVADVGLTGRKIIVDTYGGYAPHGGGAFSGKDPSKVDRSAAYAARYLAKNIVAAGLATKCTIQLSYAIGVAEPQSIYVNMHGTETDLFKRDWGTAAMLEKALLDFEENGIMDLTPAGIIEHLDLKKPIYSDTAVYGHFGRKPDDESGEFSWEKTDLRVKLLSAAVKKVATGPAKEV